MKARFFSVALVCFMTGLASSAIAGRLPGDTITNSKGTTLQFSVVNDILAIEQRSDPTCQRSRIIQTAIVGEPRRLGRMMQWSERWTLDRCGTKTVYLIHFDFRGSVGTYKIEPPQNR
jgi:hypothetical protein